MPVTVNMISDFPSSRTYGHAQTVVMEIGGAGDVIMADTDGSPETVAKPDPGRVETDAEHKAGRPVGRWS